LSGRKLTKPAIHRQDDATRTRTITLPNGGTRIVVSRVDGRPASASGTAGSEQSFDYGINPDGSTWTTVYIGPGGTASLRWVKTTRDFLGRTIRSERPGPNNSIEVAEQIYDPATGRLVESQSPGTAPLLMEYNDLGQITRAGMDINRNSTLDLASTDRITEREQGFLQSNGLWYAWSESWLYPETNLATRVRTSRSLTRLTGLGVAAPVEPSPPPSKSPSIFTATKA